MNAIADPKAAETELLRQLIQGKNVVEAAEIAGISQATAYRWIARDETKDRLHKLMLGKMSAVLPEMLDRMVAKTRDPRASLMAIAKTYDVLASKSGFGDAQSRQDIQSSALSISLNLGPDPQSEKDRQIAELKYEIEILRGTAVNGEVVTDG